MKLVLQRVSQAKVTVGKKTIGEIQKGLLVLLGIHTNDNTETILRLVNKCITLRIFEDDQGKMNRSLLDIQGSALIISQFTLYADCSKGKRPSFVDAAPPALAETIYKSFINHMRNSGVNVETGQFGADMNVHLVNNGPVTVILEK